MIDDNQREFYEENGYLLLENFVSDDWLKRLRAASDEFIEQSRGLTQSSRALDLEPDHTAESPRLRRLVSPLDQHETFYAFTIEGPVAALAQAILGSPVRFHHSKLNYKWADGGEEVKWHQDIQFWPHTDFSPLTIGLYLEDVDAEMGPMGVLPGSQKATLYDQYDEAGYWTGALRDSDVNELNLEDVTWLQGPAGSVTVHNCCMVHGSRPNCSSRVRPLLLQTYSAGTSYPVSGIGANGVAGKHSGQVIGAEPSQDLVIEGRHIHGAPDWARSGPPTIFGSQQNET